ncbi:3-hydroxyisobutyrate dehydrogenase [Thelephora terrestris]|uniref:3-hydroxyisobutyrate dehydrogenase n=1 Tax=Thelephora terrestris TaxID=56493 RepID=A0A9P6HU59_9AGAM|nr:3-hydroxyisobutyrate dehydrogenase [Thelephora terrestris]
MRATVRLHALTRRATSGVIPANRSNNVAFIGLGRMGYEMATNLWKKKFAQNSSGELIVCDARQEVAMRFVEETNGRSASFVKTPREAVLSAETIITMLPSSPHVVSVYEGFSEGIIHTLKELPAEEAQKTLCIDSTTCHVSTSQELAQTMGQLQVNIVDAPVSGGVSGAKAGTLSFLVGGPERSFELAVPFLDLMGKRVIHCGPSGSGLAAKICNNMVLGVQQVVVAEAMLLGQRLGLHPKVLASVINSSTGKCWASEVNNPVKGALEVPEGQAGPPAQRRYEGGFAASLMLKDMGLATGSGKMLKVPLPLGEKAEEVYAEMLKANPELINRDFSSVYKYLEKL